MNELEKYIPFEINLNKDGTLDEIMANGAYVHLEQMDDNCWWMIITQGDKSAVVHIWGKITVEETDE